MLISVQYARNIILMIYLLFLFTSTPLILISYQGKDKL